MYVCVVVVVVGRGGGEGAKNLRSSRYIPLQVRSRTAAENCQPAHFVGAALHITDKTLFYFCFISEPQATVNSTRYGSELSASPTLKQLIQFIFGDPILPRNTNIKIGFRANCLPDADACFGIVHLPLQHEEYRSFRASMNTCINCQYVGYGRG